MVDFHQDLFNERFGGEGFPDWAVLDDGVPAQPLVGFPFTYVTSPGGNRAWQSFWDDREGLHGRYAAAWRQVARAFKSRPWVMGHDLINEPWPGPVWVTCASTEGCRAFEEGPLAGMQAAAMRAIREVDREVLIWYEPAVTTQFGTKYWVPNPTRDPRAGMSFHIYCLVGAAPGVNAASCDSLEQLSMDNAVARAEANGDTLLLSEWGATADMEVVHRQADRADRSMVSWQWWHYCACDDPTTAGPGDVQALVSDPSKPPEGANVLVDKLRGVVRPYPQVVAGTPVSYSFNRGSREFGVVFSTRGADGRTFGDGSRTEIFVPELHYPDGYSVQVTDGQVVSPARSRLLVVETEGAPREVTVTVRPGAGEFPVVPPARVTAAVSPRRDRRAPRRFVVRGRVVPPEGLDSCAGRVDVRLVRGRRVVTRRRAAVAANCRYRVALERGRARGRMRVTVRFLGGGGLGPRSARAVRVRAG
jgi:endoglycosylceramidase